MSSTALMEYVRQAKLLCWAMALQKDQMTFKWTKSRTIWTDGLGNEYDLAWDSKIVDGAEILYDIYPILLNNDVKKKGKVFVGRRDSWESLQQVNHTVKRATYAIFYAGNCYVNLKELNAKILRLSHKHTHEKIQTLTMTLEKAEENATKRSLEKEKINKENLSLERQLHEMVLENTTLALRLDFQYESFRKLSEKSKAQAKEYESKVQDIRMHEET